MLLLSLLLLWLLFLLLFLFEGTMLHSGQFVSAYFCLWLQRKNNILLLADKINFLDWIAEDVSSILILILLSFDFLNLCEQCSTETGSMIRHELTHCGEKEHVCKYCVKSYTHAGDLIYMN